MNLSKTKTLTALVIGALLSSVAAAPAHADCKDAYAAEIKRLDGMINPARVTLAATGATAIAVPATMAGLGVAIAPAAVVGAPAAVVSAAIFYGVVEGLKHSYMKVVQLFKNTDKGAGKWLAKTTKHLQKKNSSVTEADVMAAVKDANSKNEFCPENDNGKVKVFIYSRVRKMLAAKIANTAETSTSEVSSDTDSLDATDTSDNDLN